jgi:hypothetical protein
MQVPTASEVETPEPEPEIQPTLEPKLEIQATTIEPKLEIQATTHSVSSMSQPLSQLQVSESCAGLHLQWLCSTLYSHPVHSELYLLLSCSVHCIHTHCTSELFTRLLLGAFECAERSCDQSCKQLVQYKTR